MPPFHWSKIPQKNSPLPLPFTLHLKTPTQGARNLVTKSEGGGGGLYLLMIMHLSRGVGCRGGGSISRLVLDKISNLIRATPHRHPTPLDKCIIMSKFFSLIFYKLENISYFAKKWKKLISN